MVCAMETGNSNCSEEARSSGILSSSANCSSARQSPKITMSSSSILLTGSPSASTLLHNRNSSSPSIPRKIMSKNFNNTIFSTSYPSNMAELQLYRVMQNASLLYYYDTLLEMGGDDVQQLCDAGEEEFLEIMSLVGMASKPLHVRRFQKSLQEWVTNTAKFKVPLILGDDFELELSSPRISSNHGLYVIESSEMNRPTYSPSSGEICALPPAASPGLSLSKRPYSPLDSTSCQLSSSSSPGSNTSLQLTPTLVDSQISKLALAAERLSKQLPQFEPKPYSTKKKMSKELELVMTMSESDPRRMDEIRRYAAIYGRFDCKRRPEKPLTLHEVSVNEAAAQICRFIPALLTRRDELFPLARQVVKDSGCHYSKTQISSSYSQRVPSYEKETSSDAPSGNSRTASRISSSDSQEMSFKRAKFDDTEGNEQGLSRQDRNSNELSITRSTLHSLFQIHTKSHVLSARESTVRNSSMVDYEETDSHFSFSNSSSPYQASQNDAEHTYLESVYQKTNEDYSDSGPEDGVKFSPKIVAASGDNIIAVANPALAMSPAMLAADTRENKN